MSSQGLRMTVARGDAAFEGWFRALRRGFQSAELTDEQVSESRTRQRYRRKVAVHDDLAPDPATPVGTFATWTSALTVPGRVDVPALAVSGVTVAATHRRRGIARALMAGELSVARDLGFPVAVLTATEASIYQRYGFAPAAMSAAWSIDVRRAGWAGPATMGRLDYVSRERARELAPALHERVRLREPGEVPVPAGHWDNLLRTRPDVERAGEVRVVIHTAPTGEVDGLLIHRIVANPSAYADATLEIDLLIAATDDAYRALWRFAIEHDLVSTVVAEERSVDEPLRWMLADERAATVSVRDHQYVRILDLAAALTARTYAAPGRFVFEVTDPLGFIDGVHSLVIDEDGRAEVTAGDAGGGQRVALGATELAALYLGAHRATALRTAGRLVAEDTEPIDRSFGSTVTPRLSFWY